MVREFEKLARDAAASNQTFVQFLLSLTELELATRSANAVASRIKDAEFPVEKDFDTYDFSVLPGLSKPKVLELARCEWIEQKYNCCLDRQPRDWQDTYFDGIGPCRLSGGPAGAVLHGGGAGQPAGEGAEAIHARPVPEATRPGRTC